jgi:hypothetical protein
VWRVCGACVTRVRRVCGACAARVRRVCGACAARVRRVCGACVARVRRVCGACAARAVARVRRVMCMAHAVRRGCGAWRVMWAARDVYYFVLYTARALRVRRVMCAARDLCGA